MPACEANAFVDSSYYCVTVWLTMAARNGTVKCLVVVCLSLPGGGVDGRSVVRATSDQCLHALGEHCPCCGRNPRSCRVRQCFDMHESASFFCLPLHPAFSLVGGARKVKVHLRLMWLLKLFTVVSLLVRGARKAALPIPYYPFFGFIFFILLILHYQAMKQLEKSLSFICRRPESLSSGIVQCMKKSGKKDEGSQATYCLSAVFLSSVFHILLP